MCMSISTHQTANSIPTMQLWTRKYHVKFAVVTLTKSSRDFHGNALWSALWLALFEKLSAHEKCQFNLQTKRLCFPSNSLVCHDVASRYVLIQVIHIMLVVCWSSVYHHFWDNIRIFIFIQDDRRESEVKVCTV